MSWLNAIIAVLRFLGLVGQEIQAAEQRKAGAAESQVEAQNAENARVGRAADAGDAARLHPETPDPYDLDKR